MKKSNLIRIGLIGCLWLLMAGISIPANPNAYATTNIADLKWNTFLGGGSEDVGASSAITSEGNIVITGFSKSSWGNPIRPHSGNDDAFVSMLDANGNLKWNTFLGGVGNDVGISLAILPSGDIVITGYSSSSWGNPLQSFTQGRDIFVALLNANGNLIWHSFFGGGNDSHGYSIAVTATGNIIIVGDSPISWGNPIIAHRGGRVGFVAMLDKNGILQWNTFIGGTTGDLAKSVAIHPSGNIVVIGSSISSWGSPIRPYTNDLIQDAFVAMLDANGNLKWNTFLGASNIDIGNSIAINPAGNIIVTGYSNNTWGNPLTQHSGSVDAFAAMLDTNGNLKWNTFLGSRLSYDQADSIAVTTLGNIIITGLSTASWGNPLHPHSNSDAGTSDLFIAMLDINGNLKWNTFAGNNDNDSGHFVTIAPSGNILIVGEATSSWGSPLRPHSGNIDALVMLLEGNEGSSSSTTTPIPTVKPTQTPTPLLQNPTATPVRPTATTVPATATPITPQPSLSATPIIDPSATTNPVAPGERKVMAFIPFLNQYIDNFEPNDAAAQAYPIRINETIKASVKTQGDTRDYYQIRLRPDRQYKITLNALDGGDLDLYVYDDARLGAEDVVKKSVNEGNVPEMVTFKPRKDTIHYVLASTFASEGPQNYELLVIEQ